MKRLYNAVKAVNPFLLIFLLMGVRYVYVGAQFGDALAFFSLCGLFAMDKYVTWKKGPDVNEVVKKQLEDIKTYVTAMSIKQGMRKEPMETPKEGQRWF
jgi:hypothetical protein